MTETWNDRLRDEMRRQNLTPGHLLQRMQEAVPGLRLSVDAIAKWLDEKAPVQQPRRRNSDALARGLGVCHAWLMEGIDPRYIGNKGSAFYKGYEQSTPTGITNRDRPRDVPIYRTSRGEQSCTMVIHKETVGFTIRTPWIADAPEVYAVRVTDGAMSPLYRSGSLVVIDPDRPPRVGECALLTLADGTSIVRHVAAITESGYTLTQYNPPQTVSLPLSEVASAHYVLSQDNLLGF